MARNDVIRASGGMIGLLARMERAVYRILDSVAAICVLVLVLLVSAQILSREFGLGWLAPADELVTLFFAWLVFLGIAVVERDNGHLRVELLDPFLRRRPRMAGAFMLGIDLLKLVFLYVMIQSGLAFYRLGAIKISPTLRWPETIWYLSLPVSAVLMTVYTLRGLLGKVVRRNNADEERRSHSEGI